MLFLVDIRIRKVCKVVGNYHLRDRGAAMQGAAMDAFSVLADELLCRIAIDMSEATLSKWGSTCKRMYIVLGDDHLWKRYCGLSPEADPARWGRNWRCLCQASRRIIRSRRASGRAPADCAMAIIGKRIIETHKTRSCGVWVTDNQHPIKEQDLGEIVYVGEMDSEYNPHGYGILCYTGPFVPHIIAEAPPRVDRQEVPLPLNTTTIDVVTRVCFRGGARTCGDLFPSNAHCFLQTEAHETATLGHTLEHSIEAMRGRTLSYRISTGDRLEGLWHRGKLRYGTTRYYDSERGLYCEGNVAEGAINGIGKSIDHEDNIYVGHWQGNEYHGHGTLTDPSGDSYACEWTDGCRGTRGTVRNAETGTVYEGDVMCETGWVKISLHDGRTIEGEWDGQRVSGFALYAHPDGSQYCGQWGTVETDSQPNGYGIHYHPSGFAHEGLWCGNVARGESVLFYKSVAYVRLYRIDHSSRILARMVIDDIDEPAQAAAAWISTRAPESTHGSDSNGHTDNDAVELALVPFDSCPLRDVNTGSLVFSVVPKGHSLPALFCAIAAAHRFML